MQLPSQAGTLAHRSLGSLGTWALVDVDYRSCSCASLILQFFSLLVLVQTTSIPKPTPFLSLFLAPLSQRPQHPQRSQGPLFLNARRPHGECSPAPLAVLICPLAQHAHKDKHHLHSHHHSHLRDTQGPWTQLARAATENGKGIGGDLGELPAHACCRDEARPCHSAEQNPPELYFYVAALCASATSLCNTSTLDGSSQS